MSNVVSVLYTEAHRIEGTVRLRERLSDALNDPLTDYLTLNDVRVSKLADPERREVAWPTSVIAKESIVVATLDQEGHESEQTRIDKVTRKSGLQIGVLVGSMELYGTGHITGQVDPLAMVRGHLQHFFPVTEATLLFPQAVDTRLTTRLALANRTRLQALTVL